MVSSHWEWVKRVQADHDAKKPFAPENGQPLKFKVGDKVTFTNDYGVEFHNLTVTGLYTKPDCECSLYANGARYYLDTDAHWFPHKESSLRHAETETQND